MGEKSKILITVKTYPLPSESHNELVCTAGVRIDGSFIRLYPIDYRYRPYWEWYKKYQWVELEIEKNLNDPRPESYRPVAKAKIKTIGEAIPTRNNWAERKRFVLAKGAQTMCWLNAQRQESCSLGIIKPRIVSDFLIEPTDRQWKAEWTALFNQFQLFGPQLKPLEKIPFKFSYQFLCEDTSCKGHKMMIEDWEVAQLYRAMRDKYRSEEIGTQKVKDKFFNTICASNIDTYFYVGTVLKYGTWVVLGTFWPKKDK